MKLFPQAGLLFFCALLFSCRQAPPLPKLGMKTMDDHGVEQLHRVDPFYGIDHHGDTVLFPENSRQIRVMNYFFTSCPTICPQMTDNLAQVQNSFQQQEKIVFISASVDPQRDQPPRLRRFMESHHIDQDQNWFFVTGEKKYLYDFARFQLYLSAMEEEGAVTEDFIHSEKVVLIDGEGFIRGFYSGTEESGMKALKRDLKRLLKEQMQAVD